VYPAVEGTKLTALIAGRDEVWLYAVDPGAAKVKRQARLGKVSPTDCLAVHGRYVCARARSTRYVADAPCR
jgi:hypothetical protein